MFKSEPLLRYLKILIFFIVSALAQVRAKLDSDLLHEDYRFCNIGRWYSSFCKVT